MRRSALSVLAKLAMRQAGRNHPGANSCGHCGRRPGRWVIYESKLMGDEGDGIRHQAGAIPKAEAQEVVGIWTA
jgi:hypothetical protein